MHLILEIKNRADEAQGVAQRSRMVPAVFDAEDDCPPLSPSCPYETLLPSVFPFSSGDTAMAAFAGRSLESVTAFLLLLSHLSFLLTPGVGSSFARSGRLGAPLQLSGMGVTVYGHVHVHCVEQGACVCTCVQKSVGTAWVGAHMPPLDSQQPEQKTKSQIALDFWLWFL